MKFVRQENEHVAIAKRVKFQAKANTIILPSVEKHLEQVSIAQDINEKAEHRYFLYYTNAGIPFDAMGELGSVIIIQKRDILAYVEPSENEEVIDSFTMKPIVNPDSEWVYAGK